MSQTNSISEKPLLACRPYPWKCGECKERTVKPAIVEYTLSIAHDGRTYTVTVPDLEIPRCEKCGYMVMISDANLRIDDALRQLLHLLTAEDIRQNREKLGLTQAELAARLGVDEATLSRWEKGWQIQQRAMDNLLRLFFTMPAVRTVLTGAHFDVGLSPTQTS